MATNSTAPEADHRPAIEIGNQPDLLDFAEAERITPAKGHGFYWFSYVVVRFDLAALLLLGLFFVGWAIWFSFQHSWRPGNLGRAFIVVALVGSFFWGKLRPLWRQRYGNATKRFTKYPYRGFDLVRFDSNGVQLKSSLGAPDVPVPWVEFAGFHEGQRIFLLIKMESHQEILISKQNMTEAQQQELRGLLQANVGSW